MTEMSHTLIRNEAPFLLLRHPHPEAMSTQRTLDTLAEITVGILPVMTLTHRKDRMTILHPKIWIMLPDILLGPALTLIDQGTILLELTPTILAKTMDTLPEEGVIIQRAAATLETTTILLAERTIPPEANMILPPGTIPMRGETTSDLATLILLVEGRGVSQVPNLVGSLKDRRLPTMLPLIARLMLPEALLLLGTLRAGERSRPSARLPNMTSEDEVDLPTIETTLPETTGAPTRPEPSLLPAPEDRCLPRVRSTTPVLQVSHLRCL